MRLDKFFTHAGLLSRKECALAVKRGRVNVNGKVITDPAVHINENEDDITFDGVRVGYSKYVYIMLNKPKGYVSSSDEPGEHTVLELLPDNIVKCNVFPSGRLDKDTTGLMIITNDGASSHRALAPKSHVEKTYAYECADMLTDSDVERMKKGITLADGYTTMPCDIVKKTDTSGVITLKEGKYHQIKRMFGACGNKITSLKRLTFGDIKLDESLEVGTWRYLTDDEINSFTQKK